jgi:hypothetical protein
MSSSEEMRRVITHSADKLRQAWEIEVKRSYPDVRITAAMDYAHGAMELLATYRPICQCHNPEDAARIVAAVNAQKSPSQPKYRDTEFLTLCTLDGRRGGDVTIGESRLFAADVLATIRAHGVAEAECMWPQLVGYELAVLERLVADIDSEGRCE